MSKNVNAVPDQGQWHFATWKLDHFCLTPFEISIDWACIDIFIRTGHRVFKWEYSRILSKSKIDAILKEHEV